MCRLHSAFLSRVDYSRSGHSFFFFFNDTATTEIYTLSLHDALPIFRRLHRGEPLPELGRRQLDVKKRRLDVELSRSEEPRLNSSHSQISYAVFCLKKKKRIVSSLRTRRPPRSVPRSTD